MIRWPDTPVEDFPLEDRRVLYVLVTTPTDQAPLHRYLSERNYVPMLLDGEDDPEQLWRFHHPDGTRPL